MPLLKEKGKTTPKSDSHGNAYLPSIDDARCCECPKNKHKPTMQYRGTRQQVFFCKTCGKQLTFRQMDAFSETEEYKILKKNS